MAHRPFQRGILVALIGLLIAGATWSQDEKKDKQDAPKTEEKAAADDKDAAKESDSKSQDEPSKDSSAKKQGDDKKASDNKKAGDDKKASDDKKTGEAKKADAAPKKPSAAPQDAGKPGVSAFNAKMTEWKNILKELRTIRQKHLTASEPEAKELEKQWDQLIAQGEALLPDLRETGVKAYAESKDDRSIENFLVQILNDDVARDRYEAAAELSKAMLDAGCEVKKVLDHAGVASFCTNDYENADKYLNEAKNAGVLGEQGTNFLSILPEYKEFWQTELQVREKEAAAPEDQQLPRVKITTNKGEMVVELFENEAPGAVGNFISLIEKKFYDGLTFHRVLPAFMAQGGCPRGDGTGGPGYNIYCEYDKPNYRRHFRGTLSMAHAGKDTGGSQFFITFVPTPHLNGRHTAFGRVIEGMDVLAKLKRIDPQAEGAKPDADKIVKMEVLRKRDHEYKPNKVQ